MSNGSFLRPPYSVWLCVMFWLDGGMPSADELSQARKDVTGYPDGHQRVVENLIEAVGLARDAAISLGFIHDEPQNQRDARESIILSEIGPHGLGLWRYVSPEQRRQYAQWKLYRKG